MRELSKRVTRRKAISYTVIPSDSHRGINYPSFASANGPPFFQKRSSLECCSFAFHEYAEVSHSKTYRFQLSCADCKSETEYSLVKAKNANADKRKACKTQLLSGEKGRTDVRRWIVDCYMLEHRKEQKCST